MLLEEGETQGNAVPDIYWLNVGKRDSALNFSLLLIFLTYSTITIKMICCPVSAEVLVVVH